VHVIFHLALDLNQCKEAEILESQKQKICFSNKSLWFQRLWASYCS